VRDSALRFTESLYHPNDLNNLLLQFRERGYVTLRNVFERESVDAFREEVEAALVETGEGRILLPPESPLSIAPTYAPRIRQALPGALSHASMKPHASMFEAAWLVSRPGPPISADKGWHKDRDHEGMPGREYHYPKDVHLGIYFADMTMEHGPTQAIPRSHRDPDLSPFNGSPTDSFLCRKEDAVLWDQRMWHRGTSRTVPGYRIFAIFGFHSVPIYGPDQRRMPAAQRRAWLNASDVSEQVLYGGTFLPEKDQS
jgi:hypothetical protein